jgi:glucokinase
LEEGDYIKLNDAKPRPGAPMACVGAGTGLGECFLTASAGRYTCWPSEGGHAEFSPRDQVTFDLLEHLKAKFSHKKRVSVERVVSGPGLASIYEFLRGHWAFEDHVGAPADKAFMAAHESRKAAVVAAGAAGEDHVCLKAVEIFNECYGSEVGVAALKWLPYGGLYITGGIAAKNPEWIQSKTFMDAFRDKGRMSHLVSSVPLYLITTEDTGERGALYMAVQLLDDLPDRDACEVGAGRYER